MASAKYWVWLAAQERLSVAEKAALLRSYGDPEAVFFAPKGELSRVEQLRESSMEALEKIGAQDKSFALAGGVASNTALRTSLEKACAARGIPFYVPSPVYCTDNAAMIGAAAYYDYIAGVRHGYDLNAVPNLPL